MAAARRAARPASLVASPRLSLGSDGNRVGRGGKARTERPLVRGHSRADGGRHGNDDPRGDDARQSGAHGPAAARAVGCGDRLRARQRRRDQPRKRRVAARAGNARTDPLGSALGERVRGFPGDVRSNPAHTPVASGCRLTSADG